MSAEPFSSANGEADPQGMSDALGFQREVSKEATNAPRKIRKPWSRRRDRWGKLKRPALCDVCGRKLWVNWTRSRPCMWCDQYADESKALLADEVQSAQQSAASGSSGAGDERSMNDASEFGTELPADL